MTDNQFHPIYKPVENIQTKVYRSHQISVRHVKECYMRLHATIAFSLFGLILLAASGCGGPKFYPVEGKVVYDDGAPFPGGMVLFESVEAVSSNGKTLPLSARGTIQSDGSFKLTTRSENGALAGKHRVVVSPPPENMIGLTKPPVRIVDTKYQRFDTSGLEATVTEGDNNFTFTVTRPQGK